MNLIVILGAGESGVGAALLAKEKKYNIFVSEYGQIKDKYRSELVQHDISFEEGDHTLDKILTADLIIKSPGIPEDAHVIQEIRKTKIELISEIEFASRFYSGKIIAITGSNGKTTTTLLTYHLLKEGGISVGVCGNVGRSFARLLVEDQEKEVCIIEVSSFQLDDVKLFKPHIAMVLNITADHLDRYEYQIENYARAKWKITSNQIDTDVLIYNGDDEWIQKFITAGENRQRLISIKLSNKENTSLLMSNDDTIDITQFKLKGKHNAFNAKCASEAAIVLGLTSGDIEKGLQSFSNVEHRLENITKINDVLYVNDSKATNVDSVFYALDAFDEEIIWIAGGTDKGNDYSQILSLVKERVSTLICLGVDNSKLLDYFTPHIKCIEETQDINEAAQIASRYAKSGNVVLLSPACASFDLFNNYEHRGKLFKKAVFNLIR